MGLHIAYEFHGYRFEPFNARLLAGQDVIPLTAKASDTLLVLVQQPGVIVTKQDLMTAVWPGVAVKENNLNQQISTLRKALSRDDAAVTIETVPRRGYRLVGPVRAIDVQDPPAAVPPSPSRRAPSAPARATAAQRDRHHGHDRGHRGRLGGGREFRRRPWNVWRRQLRRPTTHRSEDARARGDEMLRQGNARAAIAGQQEAIRLDPANARAYGSLAHALQAANRGTSTSAVRPAGQSPSVQAAQRGVDVDPALRELSRHARIFSLLPRLAVPEGRRALSDRHPSRPGRGRHPAVVRDAAGGHRPAGAGDRRSGHRPRARALPAVVAHHPRLGAVTTRGGTTRQSQPPIARSMSPTPIVAPGIGAARRLFQSAAAARRCTRWRRSSSRRSRRCSIARSRSAASRPVSARRSS